MTTQGHICPECRHTSLSVKLGNDGSGKVYCTDCGYTDAFTPFEQ